MSDDTVERSTAVGLELNRIARAMQPYPVDIWFEASDLWDKLFEGDSIKDKALIAEALLQAREQERMHISKILRKAGFNAAAFLLLRGDGK